MEKKKYNLGSKFYSAKTRKSVNKKINLLGVNSKVDAIKLLNMRLISSILIFFVLLYFVDFGYLIAPVVTVIYYATFISLVLDPMIKKRSKVLEKDAMYFFEILALSLEAGKNIKMSLEVTTSSIDSELSDEFKRVLKDISYGKNLNDALNDLKLRIPSDAVNNIVLNIREANIFGNNIVDTIYGQIDYIKDKRMMDAKAYISKIPVKISIVSVIFFVPLLLLLLLGPMLIELIG